MTDPQKHESHREHHLRTPAFDLDHWAEWVVLGGICATAIGVIIAVQSPRS
jgi:hypothetical protein